LPRTEARGFGQRQGLERRVVAAALGTQATRSGKRTFRGRRE